MNDELLQLLHGLIENWENEVVEFKEANKDYDKDKIGQYFSAISNEANLKGLQYGWLVFGVHNKTRMVIGSDYRDTRGLDSLKHEVAQQTGGITFTDVFEIYDGDTHIDLIINYLNQFGYGAKSDFVKLLGDKLSDILDNKQKEKKVSNLLTTMRRRGIIHYDGRTRRDGKWVLANNYGGILS